MDWDLNDLLIFTKVVSTGSFTQAAKDLGLPKSTVSRRVAKLEDHLRVPLLQRTTRKLHLTEAGRVLLDHGQVIARQWEEAEMAVSQMNDEPSGVLRFTAPTEMSPIVGPMVAAFIKEYPRVKMDISLTNRFVDMIGEGFDVAIRAAKQLNEVGLMARRIGASNLTLVASTEYIEANGVPQNPEDLSKHPMVLHPRLSHNETWKFNQAGREVEVSLNCVAGFDHLGGIRQAVLHGLGIGRIPRLYVSEDIEAGRLVEILPETTTLENSIWVVYPANRYMAPKVRTWVDFLVQNFKWR